MGFIRLERGESGDLSEVGMFVSENQVDPRINEISESLKSLRASLSNASEWEKEGIMDKIHLLSEQLGDLRGIKTSLQAGVDGRTGFRSDVLGPARINKPTHRYPKE